MNDLKLTLRQLLKSPGYTGVAVLTLALGIGVNTSMFSALQMLLARPLPYAAPESLVQVFQVSTHSRREPHLSVANFLDYQQNGDFQYMTAMNDRQFNLAESGQPAESVPGLQVSSDFFPLLGVPPLLGRVFTANEDRPGRNDVVMLDYSFWQRRFAGDTNIIGRVLRLDGESVTVVGVMPARFHDIMLMGPAYLWRPIAFSEEQRKNRGNSYIKCIARLKPNVSLEQAQAATDVMAARQRQDHPVNSADGLQLIPLAKASLPPQARAIVWWIMALAGFVLLIACANLANLQLARSSMRGREFAIRAALGAPRGRLLGQLLVESLLLAFMGGSVGLVLAQWSNDLLQRQFVVSGESVLHLQLNLTVLAFALFASISAGLAFGLIPAWLVSRSAVNEALKQGGRGTTGDRSQHRLQHSLIIAEVALAMVLLTGASLVVDGLRRFAAVDPGWRVDGLMLGYLTLPEAKYANGNQMRDFSNRLEERLAATPGVESVAVCWNLPLRQFNVSSSFDIKGRPEPKENTRQICSVNGVTPTYFKVLGMRLLQGRFFTTQDQTNRPPVVIINETMAHAFWPDRSALGEYVNGAEVIGVVSNVRFPANPAEPGPPFQTYRPFAQEPRGYLNVAVRGNLSVEMLRRAVADIDSDQPLGDPGSARADVNRSLGSWSIGGKLLSIFSFLGVSLAALGLYGVISGFVARRTSEIGVRTALGAQVRDVLCLVVGKGLRLSLIGTALGLIGSYGISRLLASVLPELPPSNPLVILFVAALLLATAILASLIPARRAARIDPIVALRIE
jgi:predicted permease